MLKHVHTLFIAALMGVTTACMGGDSEPLVGDWVSDDQIGGQRNELQIEDDMRGESVIYFYYDDGFYYLEFEVELRDSSGDRYELDFECDGNCAEFDFTMDCELRRDGDELDCEGDNGWENYEFVWVRD